ncbi:MAG: hypothetical protein JXB88_23830 [Spirochaetales bacterium]|nr:hypothetical protein [Spirochaetales bacterium]
MKNSTKQLIVVLFIFMSISLAGAAELGDVNGNNTIDIVDALLIAQFYVGLNPPVFNQAYADVDCTGGISIIDALLVAQYYVNLLPEFPCHTGPAPDKWTIMVYLDADNDLEQYGIEDLNEIEGVDFSGTGINVIALTDRSPGYDTSNGNWADTRLFEVTHDFSGSMNSAIVSTEIASIELGLTTGGSEELNMGDPAVCSHFIDFCKNNYPADNYFLILWNHGSGWKNNPGYVEKSFPGNLPLPFDGRNPRTRAVCTDDTNSDVLYTKEIGNSIEGKGITVVGFDACYSSMIEVAYELRNDADYMIASEETEGADGWEYDIWLHSFISTGLDVTDLITCVINSYKTKYTTMSGTTLAAIDLSEIDKVMTALNNFSNVLYHSITNADIQNRIAQTLFMNVESFYDITTGNGDVNLDIWHMAEVIRTTYDYADNEAAALKAAVDSAVVYEWHNPDAGVTGNSNAHGIAIHLIMMNNGLPSSHDLAYCRGYSWAYPLGFVASSDWVIHYPSGPGFLYRLWYETF